MGAVVSAIHVKTLMETLDKPSTMKALIRKTGYPARLVLQYISEARSNGKDIRATSRGKYAEAEPTLYSRGDA